MQVLRKEVLRGPNIWSNYRRQLIQVKLDLGEMENFPTNKLPGFKEKLESLLPGIATHECSEGRPGGFLHRLEEGTWLGHVMEHVALELQSVAGMTAGYGRTRGTGKTGEYHVVFAYEVEEAGLYAADAAFRIVDTLSRGENYDITADLDELRYLKRAHGLGPSTGSIVAEAEKRGIPWMRLDAGIQLGYGAHRKMIQATITGNTSNVAVDIAGDKDETRKVLSRACIPIAEGALCSNEENLESLIAQVGFPIVIKPYDGNQGKGVTTNINDMEQAHVAFAIAKQRSSAVLVEKFIAGHDFRILVIDGKFAAASKRIPAHVIGDGRRTVRELLEIVNADPRRGEGHEAVLTKIKFDADTFAMLETQGLTFESVPAAMQFVVLKSTANLSTGGTAVDVTDTVHPENRFMAERAARIVGLDVCGLDIMATTLEEPIAETGGVVLEVNAAPGFRMHLAPSEGQPRNVAKAVVDMLFPEKTPHSIPLFAVTGTNGKTTTTRLLAHIAKTAGYTPGYTTTDGIYVDGHCIAKGDTTGPVSGKVILSEPTVDFAVLETARGGILRSGLAFGQCDVAVLTNIREDHLGLNDINTLADLANVKGVVVRAVKESGWAILNAEDAHCLKIGRTLDSNVAYFSLDENNGDFLRLIEKGFPGITVHHGNIVLIIDREYMTLGPLTDVPLTVDGKCNYMVANTLGAVLAAYMWGIPKDVILAALRTFRPGFEQTPGRLNQFEFRDFTVLVDYAHNPHGYAAIESFLENVTATRKVGIISGIGDRRDEDIRSCAAIAVRMFDHIIIRQEHDLRGRSSAEILQILTSEIESSGKKVTYEIVPEEDEAIRHALQNAEPGDYIVALSDLYQKVIDVIREELGHEKKVIPVSSEVQSLAS